MIDIKNLLQNKFKKGEELTNERLTKIPSKNSVRRVRFLQSQEKDKKL